MVERLEPTALQQRIASGAELVLLDVREPDEVAICSLTDVLNIPLGDLPRRAAELDPSAAIVCICHHGIRSAQAAAYLERAGFERVSNLQGGVERWAREIDPRMPRY